MIPKLIHYCWFGNNKFTKIEKKCIESWKRVLPDYEIKIWNEENFDININEFVSQAYNAKKFAFVSDYVRLKVLFENGGIYLDTDVEVLQCFDNFLNQDAFIGYQDSQQLQTAVIGSIQNGSWVKENLDYYTNLKFIKSDGNFDTTPNVKIISDLLIHKNVTLNNEFLRLPEVTLYPQDFFCPKDFSTGKIVLSNNTVCIHHFNASWYTFFEKLQLKLWNYYNKTKWCKFFFEFLIKQKKNIQ